MPTFRISTEALDGWLLTGVFVPRLLVVTVSEKGALCLWHGGTGQLLHSQHTLTAELEGEAPTCSVLLPKLGWVMAGFSRGSLLMVRLTCSDHLRGLGSRQGLSPQRRPLGGPA